MAPRRNLSTKRDVRVFLSYSHKDKVWKDRVVTQLTAFVQQGDIVLWDDRKIDTGSDWYPAIKEQIDQSDVAICLISAHYLASDFINKEEIPDLKRRRQEEGMLLMPLLLSPCPWKAIRWLRSIQMFPRDDLSLDEIKPKVRQEKLLATFAMEIHEQVGARGLALRAPRVQISYELVIPKEAVVTSPSFAPPEKVEITRLPETGARLFGRDKELRLLDELWDSGSANVVSLVAWGGVGKSTLVNQWLQYLKADNYRGAKRVYGWSFYSQGTGQRVTSADQFISQALAWFGDPAPEQGSPWDKGGRLAGLICRQKTLLILDGLEPLQSGFGFDKGGITDPALSVLVKQLAKQNNGLCVITTREKVGELARHQRTTLELNLEQISKQAGRALLRVGGVQGTDDELKAASEAFGNHALAISLLAAYLHGIEGHHISNAASIPDLDIAEAKGKHPRRMIEAFHTRFGDSPETQVLRIMGLFDRPPSLALIDAVKAPPPIAGLTDNLQGLTETQWHNVLDKLRACRLLSPKSSHNPAVLDCHPLIREHFADKLRNENPDAWQEAHRRLYVHFRDLPTAHRPHTLDDMEPLFHAVAHACYAGRHREACRVYVDRVLQDKSQPFLFRQRFGAYASDLATTAPFFKDNAWTELVPGLSPDDVTIIYSEAGLSLLALGRVREAETPLRLEV